MPQEVGIRETLQVVGIGVMLQVVEKEVSRVGEMEGTPLEERRVTPPGGKKVTTRVGETEETPQEVERGVIPQAAGRDEKPQAVGM